MTRLRWGFLLLALSTALLHLSAQTYYRGERTSATQPSTTQDLLALRLSAEGFFRNDEYASDLVADYTLPGYRLQVDLGYRPRTELPIELRLGLYHQYYWGASRYPAALAYQDLPYWRGDGKDYTRLRVLPFFRASIQPVRGLAILLGHLEGGARHELIAPLYSPELNLTADPETGLQIRYEGKRTQLDTWVDWQSFIFKGDTHPEAFVFGLHARQAFPLSSRSQLELQLQALAHHRGGVLNERADTVHTWLNSALGLAYEHHFLLREHPLTLRSAVYGALYSQRGEHYPLDKGWGSMPRPASDTGAGARSLATGMARTSSASSARPSCRASGGQDAQLSTAITHATSPGAQATASSRGSTIPSGSQGESGCTPIRRTATAPISRLTSAYPPTSGSSSGSDT